MPSRKQQRRRQKLKRHEYEEVYVDEQGRVLDPEEAEELVDAPGEACESRKRGAQLAAAAASSTHPRGVARAGGDCSSSR